jgi:RNA polymerase sigma factor (sigma-70 family)
MNANSTIEPEVITDAELVQLSLDGDRESFGRIVARYQSPICALAYSSCGNIARSEDLAQDIFITAWRKLATLREPAKFRAWLYGIARNLIYATFRDRAHNPLTDAENLDDDAPAAVTVPEPDTQAISKEEEDILWHVISGLPAIYREPMVLFYRQDESISRVAEVLDISEDAVRQRLSRGRALLNERVAKVIQNGLRSSGPGKAFAPAVIAALPLFAAATTTKGAIVGIAATEEAAGSAKGLAAFLKALVVPAVPAALGVYLGFKMGRDAVSGTPGQRRAAARFWRVFAICFGAFCIAPFLLTILIAGHLHDEARLHFLTIMKYWLGISYPLMVAMLVTWIWGRRCTARNEPSDPRKMPADAQASEVSRTAKRFTRLVGSIALIAAGLLVFLLCDTNYNIQWPSQPELRAIIQSTPAANIEASVLQGHPHSAFHESPQFYTNLFVKVRGAGKVAKYYAGVDEETLALIRQRGIACPTYVGGRDFEVLGTPGRLTILSIPFVVAISAMFLAKRYWETKKAAAIATSHA